ncbi:helix-turn-helix domain-containing protein, partial [Shewanella algae]|uniref:helix-turn-helix domain-containing protein n=1 Tax=Shewanella algae TaxID=38313 RepID=UPI0021B41140
MDREIQQRRQWVKMYEECSDAGLVCRRCGISRPTLRKWAKRYKQFGIAGLESQSRRPHSSPDTKVICPDSFGHHAKRVKSFNEVNNDIK